MRIFSNFDTKIRQKAYQEHIDQYGEGNVLCFGRSRLYWVMKVLFPMIGLVVSFLGMTYLFYYLLDGDFLGYILLVTSTFFLIFLLPVIGKYFDYKLDFIIVTPDFLIMYNQSGIFNKKVVTINEKSIKTISIERSGLLYSIFDNGDIIFLSEGDVVHGEITLKWIPRPEKRRNEIAAIMNKD